MLLPVSVGLPALHGYVTHSCTPTDIQTDTSAFLKKDGGGGKRICTFNVLVSFEECVSLGKGTCSFH